MNQVDNELFCTIIIIILAICCLSVNLFDKALCHKH